MKYIFMVLFLTACGDYGPTGDNATTAVAFTWQTALKDCGVCHGAAGIKPEPFMASEAAFKAAQGVHDKVVAKLMPKGNPYSDAKIKSFLAYFGG